MSEAKHTPGPWITDGYNIFGPPDSRSKHAAERAANASVMRAAPELLEALKDDCRHGSAEHRSPRDRAESPGPCGVGWTPSAIKGTVGKDGE